MGQGKPPLQSLSFRSGGSGPGEQAREALFWAKRGVIELNSASPHLGPQSFLQTPLTPTVAFFPLSNFLVEIEQPVTNEFPNRLISEENYNLPQIPALLIFTDLVDAVVGEEKLAFVSFRLREWTTFAGYHAWHLLFLTRNFPTADAGNIKTTSCRRSVFTSQESSSLDQREWSVSVGR